MGSFLNFDSVCKIQVIHLAAERQPEFGSFSAVAAREANRIPSAGRDHVRAFNLDPLAILRGFETISRTGLTYILPKALRILAGVMG